MKDEDIEISLLEALANELGKKPPVLIHEPGNTFSPRGAHEWIEPRITAIRRSPLSGARGDEVDEMDLTIRCFLEVQQKGKRKGELSCLVDRVRSVVDSTLRVPAVRVRQKKTGAEDGLIEFGPADETRAYGVTATIDDVTIKGLDIATIEVIAFLRGGSC